MKAQKEKVQKENTIEPIEKGFCGFDPTPRTCIAFKKVARAVAGRKHDAHRGLLFLETPKNRTQTLAEVDWVLAGADVCAARVPYKFGRVPLLVKAGRKVRLRLARARASAASR